MSVKGDNESKKKRQSSSKQTKGDPICFCGGTHDGKLGWINTAKPFIGHCIPVIMDMGSSEEKLTHVSMWNLAKCHPAKPTSFAEALLIQTPSVGKTHAEIGQAIIICWCN
eukprot:6012081-Ditylum_brightwellii.AAC.1